MKKRLNRCLSIISVLAILFCLTPSVAGETETPEEESPYIDITSLPDNIRLLFAPEELTGHGISMQSAVNGISAVPEVNILDTDDINSIQIEDANGNGVAKVFGVPIRYEDENGEMQFIDTSMTEESLVTSIISGYDYRNTANTNTYRFSQKPDKGIRVDDAFTYAVYNPDKNKLPKGYVDQTAEGNGRMVYPEAFGEHTYVEYINTNTGIKENIVLEENIGCNRFEFVFKSEKYIPVLSEDSTMIHIVHQDNPEEILYSFMPLYVYDSYKPNAYDTIEEEPSKEPVFTGPGIAGYEGEPIIDEDGEEPIRHFTEDNHYELTELSDGSYKITSVVSEEFLNSPHTVYPVTIDPTFSATDSNAQDSYVWGAFPTYTYGSLDYLRFGRLSGGDMIAYFRFNQLPTISKNVNIIGATLKFTFRSGQTSGAEGACAMIIKEQWYESSINWHNQPWGHWSFLSSHNNFQYYNFYVRPFVDMWYNGDYPNYGVNVTYSNMINDYNSVVSCEGEAARAPTLTIEYSSATTVNADTYYGGSLDKATYKWYRFIPTVSGKYSFTSTGSTNTYGELYEGATRLAVNDDSGDGTNFRIVYNLTAGKTYFLKVHGNDYYQTGSFRIIISNDPFHPANIEYVRIKRYDMSAHDGDNDVTTIVTKSCLLDERYFECFAPDRADVSFIINDRLISELKAQVDIYLSYPLINGPGSAFYKAKLYLDKLVAAGIISSGSEEYYGIWVIEANNILREVNQISSQIQLTLATITAMYSTYNVVTAIKNAQMAMNSTQTIYTAAYKASADDVDGLFAELSRNNAKYDKKNTMWIARRPDGKVSWLEVGKVGTAKDAGFLHILDHHPLSQFKDFGVTSNAQLSNLIYDAVKNRTPTQILPGDQYVYSINGRILSVIISSNGYIVTAHTGI